MTQSIDVQALGIFGGTFDPIHFGHLNPVREAAGILGLKQVRFVPVAMPPHRSMPVADSQHRLAMIKLALKDYPDFKPDDREIKRAGSSFTINTLESFREEFGKNIPIMMLVGADVFSEFNTWHQWQHIPDLVHIIVMTRPDYPAVDTSFLETEITEPPKWKECKNINHLYGQSHGLVFFQTVAPINITATEIRSLLASGKPVDTCLPPEVIGYIRKNKLYAFQPQEN